MLDKSRDVGALTTPRWYDAQRPIFSGRNQVVLLKNGFEFFPALIEAIASAQREVLVETYIFNDDHAALEIADALIAAARRQVEVYVLVDGFGSGRSIPALTQRFAGTGVEFRVFRRVRGWTDVFVRGAWRRLHRKLVQIDRKVAFVGGINFIDDRFDLHHGWFDIPRLDFAVRVEGPLVGSIAQAMHAMRMRQRLRRGDFSALSRFDDESDAFENIRTLFDRSRSAAKSIDAEYDDASPMRAAFVVRDNFRQRRTIERSYIEAIVQARERVAIINPYFYPARFLRRALIRAASRGVEVVLVMQGKPDYRIAAWAAHAMYEELIRAGIRIVEYTPSFLHAKVAVVDDVWATVGSSNIDPLSLLANREANVLVMDREFCASVRSAIDDAIAVSDPVGSDHPATHGFGAWVVQRVVAIAAHVLITVAGGVKRY